MLLHNCFDQHFVAKYKASQAYFFLFIKIKAQHVSFFQVIMLQIPYKLLLSAFLIGISPPDFQLNHDPLAMVIYNYVGSFHVSGSGLNIIISSVKDPYSNALHKRTGFYPEWLLYRYPYSDSRSTLKKIVKNHFENPVGNRDYAVYVFHKAKHFGHAKGRTQRIIRYFFSGKQDRIYDIF